MNTYKPLIFLSFVLISLTLPAQASAQEEEPPLISRVLGGSVILAALSTSTYVTILRTGQQRRNEKLEQEIKELEALAMLDAYMQGGQTDLQDDLSLGTDTALRDIATIMFISTQDYPAWRKSVLSQRHAIDPSADVHALYHVLASPADDSAPCALLSTPNLQGVWP